MNTVAIGIRLLAGLALGIFFYGGLWYTVRHLPGSSHPGLLTLGSFWIRTLTVLGGFLFLMEQRWDYAAVCLVGFVMGRVTVTKFLSRQAARPRCI